MIFTYQLDHKYIFYLKEMKNLSEAVGKDIEESWGLWLQEYCEKDKINFENKIWNPFNNIEKEIFSIYIKEKSDLI